MMKLPIDPMRLQSLLRSLAKFQIFNGTQWKYWVLEESCNFIVLSFPAMLGEKLETRQIRLRFSSLLESVDAIAPVRGLLSILRFVSKNCMCQIRTYSEPGVK